MIGSRLGPYEITAKLGEGGMGEVYRATDSVELPGGRVLCRTGASSSSAPHRRPAVSR